MLEMLWNAPVSESSMSQIIEALDLDPGQSVLDLGCGCGEVLIRICERFDVAGTGVDVSSRYIDEARKRASPRVSESVIQFVAADVRGYPFPKESLDLGICMGASHAFGLGPDAYSTAIENLQQLVKPGGVLLLAEGYMKQPASPEYRKLLGDSVPDEMTHAANVAVGIEKGLVPMAAWTSSDDEWDNFEWGYQRIVEQQAAARPKDPEMKNKLSQRRAWMEAYLLWGRETLGYGTYLFKKSTT